MIENSVTSQENSPQSERDPTSDVLCRTQARPPSSHILHFDNLLISIDPLGQIVCIESTLLLTALPSAFVGTPDIVFLVFLRKHLVLNRPKLVVLHANTQFVSGILPIHHDECSNYSRTMAVTP